MLSSMQLKASHLFDVRNGDVQQFTDVIVFTLLVMFASTVLLII
jgi:hypothetical protein